VEGELIVLEKVDYAYRNSKCDVNSLLPLICQRGKYAGNSIKDLLEHPLFGAKAFIEQSLKPDDSGIPRLFKYSYKALKELFELGSKMVDMDPLKLVDPASNRNIFIQAAHWGDKELLVTISSLFPAALKLHGQEIIEILIRQENYTFARICEEFNKQGGRLDIFHEMLVAVAIGLQLNVKSGDFIKLIQSFSPGQMRDVYNAAYAFNNPSIYEPAKNPVAVDQYSLNFLWVNKNRMSVDQEFLFGAGDTPEKRLADFQEKFVKPVSNWVKANPGSAVNIWYDGEFATSEAVSRSQKLLLSQLEEVFHSKINFRNVRTLEVVKANPDIFTESMPVYFRVDLLKAVTADETLRKKEGKYFVFCDLDVQAQLSNQLFDQRTMEFLADYGFVMAKGGHLGFENSFQIFNGENKQLMESHRKVIIDLTLEMARVSPRSIKDQVLYDTYIPMITHFLDADGRFGKFCPRIERGTEEDDKLAEDPVEKLRRFRYDIFSNACYKDIPIGTKKGLEIRKIMPRKPVIVPPSHFGF
jgi:hypothetical protein